MAGKRQFLKTAVSKLLKRSKKEVSKLSMLNCTKLALTMGQEKSKQTTYLHHAASLNTLRGNSPRALSPLQEESSSTSTDLRHGLNVDNATQSQRPAQEPQSDNARSIVRPPSPLTTDRPGTAQKTGPSAHPTLHLTSTPPERNLEFLFASNPPSPIITPSNDWRLEVPEKFKLESIQGATMVRPVVRPSRSFSDFKANHGNLRSSEDFVRLKKAIEWTRENVTEKSSSNSRTEPDDEDDDDDQVLCSVLAGMITGPGVSGVTDDTYWTEIEQAREEAASEAMVELADVRRELSRDISTLKAQGALSRIAHRREVAALKKELRQARGELDDVKEENVELRQDLRLAEHDRNAYKDALEEVSSQTLDILTAEERRTKAKAMDKDQIVELLQRNEALEKSAETLYKDSEALMNELVDEGVKISRKCEVAIVSLDYVDQRYEKLVSAVQKSGIVLNDEDKEQLIPHVGEKEMQNRQMAKSRGGMMMTRVWRDYWQDRNERLHFKAAKKGCDTTQSLTVTCLNMQARIEELEGQVSRMGGRY